MKKGMFIAAGLLLMVFWAGCKKSDNNKNNSTNYYIKFDLNGKHYEYNDQSVNIGHSSPEEVGGNIFGSSVNDAAGWSYSWTDTLKKTEVLRLANTTLYFNDSLNTLLDVFIEQGSTISEAIGVNQDSSYNLHINSVDFLRTDSTDLLYTVNVYEIKGTFKAKLYDRSSGNYVGDATNGEFDMACTAWASN